MSRVRKLTDIEIDEVSVVDRPANQHGLIAFSKSLAPRVRVRKEGSDQEGGTMPPDADVIYDVDGDEVDPGLLEHGDVVYDETGNEYVFVEDDSADEEVGKGVWDAPGKFLAGLKSGRKAIGEAGKAGMSPTRGAVMANVGDPAALGRARTAGVNTASHLARNKKRYMIGGGVGAAGAAGAGAYGLSKSAGDTVLEALSKAATDDDRDAIIAKAMDDVEVYKALAQENAEALAYEQDIRLTDAYISKAAEYNLPVSPAVFGPILKSIAAALTDEELDVLDAIFEAIGDALYDEVGYVGDTDNGSVVDMVDAYADELVGKSDLSHAEAAVAMYSAHPEAYEAYLTENGR
jgi:hypothetical protein